MTEKTPALPTPWQMEKIQDENMDDVQVKQCMEREAEMNKPEEFIVGNKESVDKWVYNFERFRESLKNTLNVLVRAYGGDVERDDKGVFKNEGDEYTPCGIFILEIAKKLGLKNITMYMGEEFGHSGPAFTYLYGKDMISTDDLKKIRTGTLVEDKSLNDDEIIFSKDKDDRDRITTSGKKDIRFKMDNELKIICGKKTPKNNGYIKDLNLLSENLKGKYILYIDDKREVDEVEIMKEKGCIIRRAKNFNEALYYLLYDKFDEVILDGHFPFGNLRGINPSLVRKIRPRIEMRDDERISQSIDSLKEELNMDLIVDNAIKKIKNSPK